MFLPTDLLEKCVALVRRYNDKQQGISLGQMSDKLSNMESSFRLFKTCEVPNFFVNELGIALVSQAGEPDCCFDAGILTSPFISRIEQKEDVVSLVVPTDFFDNVGEIIPAYRDVLEKEVGAAILKVKELAEDEDFLAEREWGYVWVGSEMAGAGRSFNLFLKLAHCVV